MPQGQQVLLGLRAVLQELQALREQQELQALREQLGKAQQELLAQPVLPELRVLRVM